MAGFERQWEPPQRLPVLVELVGVERKVGEQKATFIERCAPGQPARRRIGSDEGEQSGALDEGLAVGSLETENEESRLLPGRQRSSAFEE